MQLVPPLTSAEAKAQEAVLRDITGTRSMRSGEMYGTLRVGPPVRLLDLLCKPRGLKLRAARRKADIFRQVGFDNLKHMGRDLPRARRQVVGITPDDSWDCWQLIRLAHVIF
jgi:hypothetical protein